MINENALFAVAAGALYIAITKIYDRWIGHKYDGAEAINNLLIQTNNGKDILAHLEEAKTIKLTAQSEREDMKNVVKAFPALLNKLEALTKSVDHLDKNFRAAANSKDLTADFSETLKIISNQISEIKNK